MLRLHSSPDVGPLLLPPLLYARAGQPLTIFHANLCVARDPAVFTWRYQLGADLGTLSADRWTVTPTVSSNLAVSCSYGGITISASAMVIVTPGIAPPRKILLVGDSLTADGRFPDAVAATLTSCTFLGLQTSGYGGTHHEGRSGFSFLRFATDAASPFVSGGAINIAGYLASLGNSPDAVVFVLGANDLINYTPLNAEAGLAVWKTNADALIQAWTAALPAVRLFVATTPPANTREAAFWSDYKGSITEWRWRQVRRLLLLRQFSTYASRLLPAHLRVSNADGFDPLSGIHPNGSGYSQMGAEVADALCYLLA